MLESWSYSQWIIAVHIVLALLYTASVHGEEKRVTTGEKKGQVIRHNFLARTVVFIVLILLLHNEGFWG